MKKLGLCLLFMVALSTPGHAQIEMGLKAITGNITAAYDKAYQQAMLLQVVQQTQMMFQNYNESKMYYDRMKAISDHKGGIVGYVKDDISNNIKELNSSKEKRLICYFMENV